MVTSFLRILIILIAPVIVWPCLALTPLSIIQREVLEIQIPESREVSSTLPALSSELVGYAGWVGSRNSARQGNEKSNSHNKLSNNLNTQPVPIKTKGDEVNADLSLRILFNLIINTLPVNNPRQCFQDFKVSKGI